MQFVYHEEASKDVLSLDTKEFTHIFRVRRTKVGQVLFFRNLVDDMLYSYKISSIDRKKSIMELIDKKLLKVEAKKQLHVGWCMVEAKTIEKTLPFLNELGVSKISFVYCELSQRNFKLDMQRVKKILINSSQQCGRSSLMQIEILDSLEEFLALYPDCKVLDFSSNFIDKKEEFHSFLVGCEGGFTDDERKMIDKKNIVGLKNPMILRSETAVLTLSALNS